MIRLNAFMLNDSLGQNQVLPSTRPRTRSGRSTHAAVPIGPPILAHHDEALEPQVVHELTHDAGMLFDGVGVAIGAVGQAEPEVVHGHASKPVAQGAHDVPVQEAPCRVAVAEQERRPGAFVDVVHPPVRGLEPAGLEWIQRPIR